VTGNDTIIYKGQAFCIEWYVNERGRSEVREFYEALPIERRVQFLKLVKVMGEVGKIFDTTRFRNEGDQIFAFKPQPERFLCFFFVGKKIIVTNAFHKKSDKLPISEKERALKFKASYTNRVNKGVYYEKNK
jgi:hypothetical protein